MAEGRRWEKVGEEAWRLKSEEDEEQDRLGRIMRGWGQYLISWDYSDLIFQPRPLNQLMKCQQTARYATPTYFGSLLHAADLPRPRFQG